MALALDSHATLKATEHLTMPSDGSRENADLERRWWEWVRDYMERDLTQPSDQYAAFAGVTKLHQEITCDEPVLGLWKEHLPMHLAWGASAPGDSEKPTKRITLTSARCPSWTWMTYPHGSADIIQPCFEWNVLDLKWDMTYRLGYVAEILETNVEWSGQALTSTPTGTIKISGMCSSVAPPQRYDFYASGHGGWMLLDPEVSETMRTKARYDVLALAAYMQINENFKPCAVTVCLIIEATGQGDGSQYRRVGRMKLYKRVITGIASECWPECERRTITLD